MDIQSLEADFQETHTESQQMIMSTPIAVARYGKIHIEIRNASNSGFSKYGIPTNPKILHMKLKNNLHFHRWIKVTIDIGHVIWIILGKISVSQNDIYIYHDCGHARTLTYCGFFFFAHHTENCVHSASLKKNQQFETHMNILLFNLHIVGSCWVPEIAQNINIYRKNNETVLQWSLHIEMESIIFKSEFR